MSKKSRISHGTVYDPPNLASEAEEIMTDIEELENESIIPASEGCTDAHQKAIN